MSRKRNDTSAEVKEEDFGGISKRERKTLFTRLMTMIPKSHNREEAKRAHDHKN